MNDGEEDWKLEDDQLQPLVNVISFGWTEDGRCGYPMDNQSGNK